MSKKQRRLRAEERKRHIRAGQYTGKKLPDGAIPADPSKHAPHNSYGPPEYYIDYPFICIDCGSDEVWTAEQQKWYYEVAKGPVYGRAVRCRECRRKRREQSERDRARNQANDAENPYKSPEAVLAERPKFLRALAMGLAWGTVAGTAVSILAIAWVIYGQGVGVVRFISWPEILLDCLTHYVLPCAAIGSAIALVTAAVRMIVSR